MDWRIGAKILAVNMVVKSTAAVLTAESKCTSMLDYTLMRGVSSSRACTAMAATSEPIFAIVIDWFGLPNVTQRNASNLPHNELAGVL